MRHWLTLLMLFTLLPVLDVMAAPAPEPYAILEMEAAPGESELEFSGQTPDEYRKERMEKMTYPHCLPLDVWRDPEVRKLPSVAALKDPRYWLSKNSRITWEGEGNRLRVMFRAGNRTEQVAIINSLARAYLQEVGKSGQAQLEWCLRAKENGVLDLEKRIKLTQDRQDIAIHDKELDIASYQRAIDFSRTNRIPALRAAIARYKQIAVIKWAR